MLLRKLLLTRGFGQNTPAPPSENPGDPDPSWPYENLWGAQLARSTGSGVLGIQDNILWINMEIMAK